MIFYEPLTIITNCDIIRIMRKAGKMKVLIKTDKFPECFFLARISDRKIIKKVNFLISGGRRSRAIDAAISGCDSLIEVAPADVPRVDADVILAENNAYFTVGF